jgi:FkbM family methyltransferase
MKKWLFKRLCNPFTGKLILLIYPRRIPNIRWPKFKFFVNASGINKRIIASIFFGFYESAEVRLIQRYFKGQNDVIELGGSLGIVSSHISSLMHADRKLIVVEPNPNIIPTAKMNIEQYCQSDFEILNAALAYDSPQVALSITTNNTTTQVIPDAGKDDNLCKVASTTLGKIVKEHDIKQYTLVCDIEGSEIEFILNDKEALANCKEVFIELHDTVYKKDFYLVSQLSDLIVQLGFKKVVNEGAVYFFRK